MTDGSTFQPVEPVIARGPLPPFPLDAQVSGPPLDREAQIVATQSETAILVSELSLASNSTDSLDALLRRCKDIICQSSKVVGLWMAQRNEQGELDEPFSLDDRGNDSSWRANSRPLRRLMKLAVQHRQIQQWPKSEKEVFLVAPVFDGDQISALVMGCFEAQAANAVDLELLLGSICQTISIWLVRQRCIRKDVRMRSLNDLVVLCRELDRCTSINSVAIVLVNQLKQIAGAEQVVFAVATPNGLPEVLAISDLDEIDPAFDGLQAIRLACTQALETDEIGVYPDRRTKTSDSTPALQNYCHKLGHEACISLPLKKTGSDAIGCLLIATTPIQLSKPTYTKYLSEVIQMLSGHLSVVLKSNRRLIDHALSSLNNHLTAGRSKIAAAISLSIIALLLVPWPYRVHCDCEIQPVSRRFVAAPHDGILQKNLVENGDVVSEGQTIALLDDRQLRIELAGLEAQLEGVRKQRSAATARGSIAESQIAASEVLKLTAEIEMVNEKLKNLEIASPISGIVVAGDLEKVEGAPVEMGQTLFEIGPLNNMLIEIAIPEEEINYIKTGMPIVIKLNAYPFKTWSSHIARIHSKSEQRESNNVFVAEVEVANEELKLKPGMKGSAKVNSGSFPIGWNLFHQPFEQLRYWTIW